MAVTTFFPHTILLVLHILFTTISRLLSSFLLSNSLHLSFSCHCYMQKIELGVSLVSCVYCKKEISVKCKKEDLENEQNSCQEGLNFHGLCFISHFLPMFTFHLFIVLLSICSIATILKSQEWLTINCVVNVASVALLAFYIYRAQGCVKIT